MPVIVLAFPNVQIMRVSNYVPCSGRARGWSILDYAEAPAQFFEEWQITCPIRHVAVTSVLAIPSIGLGYMGGATRSGEPDLAITLQLVRHATPSILSFPIMAYAALASTFWTPLVQSVSKLRGLQIDLCEFKETSDSQLVSVLRHWMVSSVARHSTWRGHLTQRSLDAGDCASHIRVNVHPLVHPDQNRLSSEAAQFLRDHSGDGS